MFEKGLVVEVDGGQHGEEAIARRDEERTRWLNGKGYRGAVPEQAHTLTLALSRQGRGDGERRHERMGAWQSGNDNMLSM